MRCYILLLLFAIADYTFATYNRYNYYNRSTSTKTDSTNLDLKDEYVDITPPACLERDTDVDTDDDANDDEDSEDCENRKGYYHDYYKGVLGDYFRSRSKRTYYGYKYYRRNSTSSGRRCRTNSDRYYKARSRRHYNRYYTKAYSSSSTSREGWEKGNATHGIFCIKRIYKIYYRYYGRKKRTYYYKNYYDSSSRRYNKGTYKPYTKAYHHGSSSKGDGATVKPYRIYRTKAYHHGSSSKSGWRRTKPYHNYVTKAYHHGSSSKGDGRTVKPYHTKAYNHKPYYKPYYHRYQKKVRYSRCVKYVKIPFCDGTPTPPPTRPPTGPPTRPPTRPPTPPPTRPPTRPPTPPPTRPPTPPPTRPPTPSPSPPTTPCPPSETWPVRPVYNTEYDKGFLINGYKLGKSRSSDLEKWNDVKLGDLTRQDWYDESLWRIFANYWFKIVLPNRDDPNFFFQSCIDAYPRNCSQGFSLGVFHIGAENAYCKVCSGEDSEQDCIENGVWTECADGQDGCILETFHQEDCSRKFYRRCGAKCECGWKDPTYARRDVLSCMRSTCGEQFDCMQYDCIERMFGDVRLPNSAYYYDEYNVLKKCRCDGWCYEEQYQLIEDPDYDLECCPATCDPHPYSCESFYALIGISQIKPYCDGIRSENAAAVTS